MTCNQITCMRNRYLFPCSNQIPVSAWYILIFIQSHVEHLFLHVHAVDLTIFVPANILYVDIVTNMQ